MKIICLSDTHMIHNKLHVPCGDVIVHCGDFTHFGRMSELDDFLSWFTELPHKHKIIVPGNHEVTLCPRKRSIFTSHPSASIFDRIDEVLKKYPDVVFLVQEGVVIDGVKFYGSPYCSGDPRIMDKWGFFMRTIDEKRSVWDDIPSDTDVLLTHMPPAGILDSGMGCEVLREKVLQVEPYLHIFGHIHSGRGETYTEKTYFINASCLDDSGREIFAPIVHEI